MTVKPSLKTKNPAVLTALLRPLALIGIGIVLLWVILSWLAPWVTPAGPTDQAFDRLLAPNSTNILGTDSVGRDVFSRILYEAPTSIGIALAVVAGSVVSGVTLGAIAGYFGRGVDEVIMRLTDLVFAFPTITLAMIIAASLGPSLMNAAIALLLVSWPPYARVTRSLVMVASQQKYVIAARLLGQSPLRTLGREIFPNVIAPVLILGTLNLGTVMMELAGLSFLGLGATPPAADWGAMVSDGMRQFDAWWISLPAGLAIVSLVLAFNFVGDALRDSFEPNLGRNGAIR